MNVAGESENYCSNRNSLFVRKVDDAISFRPRGVKLAFRRPNALSTVKKFTLSDRGFMYEFSDAALA